MMRDYKGTLHMLAGHYFGLSQVNWDDHAAVLAELDRIEAEIKVKRDLASPEEQKDLVRSVERCQLVREALKVLDLPNAYEEKQQARRERLEERAEAASAASDASYASAKRIADVIPLGQPILVGHHSEKRHRRDVKRIQNGMAKSLELADKARDLERRAAAVGNAGISSDDPQAILKLKLKLEALEIRRELEKEANAAMRKSVKAFEKREGRPATQADHIALALALEVPGDVRAHLVSHARAFPWIPQCGPHTATEARRVAARIKELEANTSQPEREPIDGDGWSIEDNARENRVQISFAGKPAEDVRAKLKSAGFRWAPSLGVWQRQRNNAAWAAAKRAMGVAP